MNQKWRMKMKKNIFLTILLLTASGLNAAVPHSGFGASRPSAKATNAIDATNNAYAASHSGTVPTPQQPKILPGVPTPTPPMTNATAILPVLPEHVLKQMTATAKANAAVHKANPTVVNATKKVAGQARTMATTTAAHVSAQARTLATQATNTSKTIIQHVQTLKAAADKSGFTNQALETVGHIRNAWDFAQSKPLRSALVDYGAGQQQTAAAGGLATAAGRSIHASFQQHMQAQHGPTVQQAIQHMQNIQASINGFLSAEMLAAVLSADSNQGQAALNVLDALNDVLGPIADYINSGQAQAMLEQMTAAMDASK
jgi:hypothetical protein